MREAGQTQGTRIRPFLVVTSPPRVQANKQVETEAVDDPESIQSPASDRLDHGNRQPSMEERHPAPDEKPSVDGSTGVAIFLASLRPSQAASLPLFESLGVTALEELHGLAHMTEKSLEAFLARAVRGSFWLGIFSGMN
jgi:hypothetical protein